jgi:hypothetical protein
MIYIFYITTFGNRWHDTGYMKPYGTVTFLSIQFIIFISTMLTHPNYKYMALLKVGHRIQITCGNYNGKMGSLWSWSSTRFDTKLKSIMLVLDGSPAHTVPIFMKCNPLHHHLVTITGTLQDYLLHLILLLLDLLLSVFQTSLIPLLQANLLSNLDMDLRLPLKSY